MNCLTPSHLARFGELERLDIGETLSEVGQSVMDGARRRALEQGAKDMEVSIVNGNPAEEILKAAEQNDDDMIVVGSRGLGNLEGILLGSVSKKVSHLAKQTCITVR